MRSRSTSATYAAFPLAIPLIAGPGALPRHCCSPGVPPSDAASLAILIGIIVAIGCACVITFLLAEKVAGALGITGNVVLSRLLGIVLAALAVQFVIDGVRMAVG